MEDTGKITKTEGICGCEHFGGLRARIKKTEELEGLCDSLKEEFGRRHNKFGNEKSYFEAQQNLFLCRRYLQLVSKFQESLDRIVGLQTQFLEAGEIELKYRFKKEKHYKKIPRLISKLVHRLKAYFDNLDIILKNRLNGFYPIDLSYFCNRCESEVNV